MYIKTHKGDDYLKLLSTKEAAKILNVNPSRVRQLYLAKRIPAMKIGGSLVFKEMDLKKVADRNSGRPKKKIRRKK
ncbi:MAG TPA: DNA-binding protein [Bacteroidetes bacterium]|nr:DNA-binding protein [Bacteroidota bacterium]